jgi:hypothetical protein
MHRHARDGHSGGEHGVVDAAAIHAGSAECRQKRGMYVHDAACITIRDSGRYVAQVSSERDELDVLRGEYFLELDATSLFPNGDDVHRDPTGPRPRQRTRVRAIACDDDDVATSPFAEHLEVLEDRLKIRPAAGCEHGNARSGHGAETSRM